MAGNLFSLEQILMPLERPESLELPVTEPYAMNVMEREQCLILIV